MAETYFYTVTSGTFTRSNPDGGQTTFIKGESLESEDPDLATRKKNLEPLVTSKMPAPNGMLPKRVGVEVASTTVAAAQAAAAREAASKSHAKAREPEKLKVEPVIPGVTEKPSEKPSEKSKG